MHGAWFVWARLIGSPVSQWLNEWLSGGRRSRRSKRTLKMTSQAPQQRQSNRKTDIQGKASILYRSLLVCAFKEETLGPDQETNSIVANIIIIIIIINDHFYCLSILKDDWVCSTKLTIFKYIIIPYKLTMMTINWNKIRLGWTGVVWLSGMSGCWWCVAKLCRYEWRWWRGSSVWDWMEDQNWVS